eukprot:1015202_1
MDLEYSSILSIIYFSVNIIFLGGLGLIVYKQGGHEVKSKTYLQDIWSQRKIYAPLLIHFYDTATDIGVIYNWYQLMQKEQNDPDVDYTSVDMTIFFWSGITFLSVYRVCLLCFAIWEWLINGEGVWYHALLVLCDLYIFTAVYESFSEAQGLITSNAEKRLKKIQKREEERRKLREQLEKDAAEYEYEDDDEEEEEEEQEFEEEAEDVEEEELEPATKQKWIQFGEAVTESMPQIVLQSVFIIRSANDPQLRKSGSNVFLILLSIMASLFSVA